MIRCTCHSPAHRHDIVLLLSAWYDVSDVAACVEDSIQ